MPRAMIISHSHPELGHGGAEGASYAIHNMIRKGRMPGWDSVYVARADRHHIGHDGELGAFRGRVDEIIVSPPAVDHFFHSSCNIRHLYSQLDELLNFLDPDIVHIHHFLDWGIELFEYFASRKIPTIFTLHEYLAICHFNGQMIKKGGERCLQSSPAECSACFPLLTSGMFFLRDEMFRRALASVTTVVAPSNFLSERVRTWSAGAIEPRMIDNPRDLDGYDEMSLQRSYRSNSEGLRLGYFGRLSKMKGIQVLLDAVAALRQRDVDIALDVWGARLEVEDEGFKRDFGDRLEALKGTVSLAGAYRNQDVIAKMRSYDAIVVPSLWWENSPLVVQEAIHAGVDIVASHIGGIEEKLREYPRKHLYETGSVIDLARTLKALCDAKAGNAVDFKIDAKTVEAKAAADWEALRKLYRALAPLRGRVISAA